MIDLEALGESIAQAILDATEPLKRQIAELEKKLDNIPSGKDGRDGVDGKDGLPGANGKDGLDGKDGLPGEKGMDGQPGKDGKDADMEVIKEAIDQSIELKIAAAMLDIERRVSDVLMKAVSNMPAPKDGADGKDGQPGKDGKDGFGFDDMRAEYDGERGLSLVFEKDGQEKRFDFDMPVVIYKGVFKASEEHHAGDAVTFGGCLWIAQKDNPDGKPGDSADWKLAVKKGRDGKDGTDGKQGEKGDPGPRGKDLTQIGFGGEKW